ncbi:hypothetical protein [Arthrobacter sp. MDT1-65]
METRIQYAARIGGNAIIMVIIMNITAVIVAADERGAGRRTHVAHALRP